MVLDPSKLYIALEDHFKIFNDIFLSSIKIVLLSHHSDRIPERNILEEKTFVLAQFQRELNPVRHSREAWQSIWRWSCVMETSHMVAN